MNAHITTPRTVSAATLALINQILSAAGKPVPDAEFERLRKSVK